MRGRWNLALRHLMVGPKGFSWFGCWNHFEPSTSAMPSCLRVSSLLKFVIPFQVRKPVKVWSSGALGGYLSLSSSLARVRHVLATVSTAPRPGGQGGPKHPQMATSYMDYGWLRRNEYYTRRQCSIERHCSRLG